MQNFSKTREVLSFPASDTTCQHFQLQFLLATCGGARRLEKSVTNQSSIHLLTLQITKSIQIMFKNSVPAPQETVLS
jgi:hypothetical protein